ncbi:Monooxygenase FAD-binding protein [Macrophomina phaseolina MS6]|uniref:Monooxygenase FAD-binding protein n=1 Tax=Macrophomina phaseolina (strain MS6) TaxID=1126212 RepID=K2R2E5_MACPH|nr:Monooxygenase FAD-binding protein [Macrophomina phaseolina MS6]
MGQASTVDGEMSRLGRKVHYPAEDVDLLDPYLLLLHQGELERAFISDLKERGVSIRRNTAFMDLTYHAGLIEITCKADNEHRRSLVNTRYLVGCDGAHSAVRKSIPGAKLIGSSSDSVWGILDGKVQTNFPDVWSKVIIGSEEAGCVMLMPRERNLTRAYIEVKPDSRSSTSKEEISQQVVMQRAQEIMYPFHLKWKSVGKSRQSYAFPEGSARHVSLGLEELLTTSTDICSRNTAIHDAWNLAWKLNLTVRKLAKPELLATYEIERRKVAQDLVRFDEEHASAFATGDWDNLAQNFTANIRFISGVVEYEPNVLNLPTRAMGFGDLRPGRLPPPAKVTRYADANPVDVQLDIPVLGQFRIYFFCNDLLNSRPLIDFVCRHVNNSQESFTGRMSAAANASYTLQPPVASPHDEFIYPERYTPVSCLFTLALVTSQARASFEIRDLPKAIGDSIWTVYLDDVANSNTHSQERRCIDKWLGGLQGNETAIAIIRPDGYVGTLSIWQDGRREYGEDAVRWMDEYFEGFLTDTISATNS